MTSWQPWTEEEEGLLVNFSGKRVRDSQEPSHPPSGGGGCGRAFHLAMKHIWMSITQQILSPIVINGS